LFHFLLLDVSSAKLERLVNKKLASLQAKQRQFSKPEGKQKVLELEATDKLDDSSSCRSS